MTEVWGLSTTTGSVRIETTYVCTLCGDFLYGRKQDRAHRHYHFISKIRDRARARTVV